MNKKFASLGTALSRDEAKKVMGGLPIGGPENPGGNCSIQLDCGGRAGTISCGGSSGTCHFEYGSNSQGNMVLCGIVCNGGATVCPGWE
jgi:hypothetical protein